MSFMDWLFGDSPDGATERFTTEDYDGLALEIVSKENLRTHNSFSYYGSDKKCEYVLARIPKVRERLLTKTVDARLRRHVDKWINFYERTARENLEDCRTQAKRKMYDEVGRRMKEKDRRKSELASALGVRS